MQLPTEAWERFMGDATDLPEDALSKLLDVYRTVRQCNAARDRSLYHVGTGGRSGIVLCWRDLAVTGHSQAAAALEALPAPETP